MQKTVITLLIFISTLNASVEIYQDKVKLSQVPSSEFIGFNNRISASNIDGGIKVIKGECLNSKLPACEPIIKVDKLKSENTSLSKQRQVIEQTLEDICLEGNDAQKLIVYIKTLSDKISEINRQIAYNKYLVNTELNKRVYPVLSPYFLASKQSKVVDIEFSGISFTSHYVLDVDKKKMKQSIELYNRSGIDIAKTQAVIFDRRLSGIARNNKFRPILIDVSRPVLQKAKKRSYANMAMQSDSVMAMAPMKEEQRASRESTRKYKINNFSSLSNGSKKDFTVDVKPVKITKGLRWNAWQNKVYDSAEVETEQTFEGNLVDVVYKKSLIKDVGIRHEGKKIVLNLAEEYDVEVRKEEIPFYSKEKGIFSKDTLIEKGYRLFITNTSGVEKSISVVERIPVSTHEKIEVKLKGFWSVNEKNRSLLKHKHDLKIGKVAFTVVLKPGESKHYEYEFTIKHPQDMPIDY